MNDIESFLVQMQRLRDQTFVAQAWASLTATLTAIDHRWPSDGLRRHLECHGQSVIDYLRTHTGFVAVVRRVFEQYRTDLGEDEVLADSTTLTDLASLLAFLADDYSAALPLPARDEAWATIDGLLPRAAVDLLHAVLPQALLLADVIWRIEDFVRRKASDGQRIFILEFPVGNSIPSKLLDRILRAEGRDITLVRVALSRNDAKKRGMTRRQLLEERLSGLGTKKGDLVVLVDEWLSGSNFRNLTGLLEKNSAVRLATFLPVALLTDRSSSEERYKSHTDEHDRLLRALGEDGAHWRFTFPKLATRFERDGYFFWSEYDRLSGYRKFQILGSYVSSIEAAMKALAENPDAMRRARAHFLAMVSQMREDGLDGPEVTPEVLADRGVIQRLYDESLQDYEQCKDQLRAIEHMSNRGEVSEIEADIRQVVEKIHEVIDRRPAKVAVHLALSYIESEKIVDPENPYSLDAHAPVVVELDGGFRRLHECVMAEFAALTLGRRPAPAA